MTTLTDVELVATAESIDDFELVAAAPVTDDLAAGEEKGPDKIMFGRGSRDVSATVSVDDAGRAYYEQNTDWDLWIREMQVDPPNSLSATTETIPLTAQTWSVTGDEVTFSEPVEVRIVYEDVDSSVVVAAEPRIRPRMQYAHRTALSLSLIDDSLQRETGEVLQPRVVVVVPHPLSDWLVHTITVLGEVE